VVDIPLISKVWKNKRQEEPIPEQDEEMAEEERQMDEQAIERAGYARGLRDADMEEGIEGRPLPDDAKYQFFGGNIFGQHPIEKADISRLILPSLSTSYHQKDITLAAEIPPFLSRIIYSEIDILRLWGDRLEKNQEKYWFGDDNERRNIYQELKYFTLYKLDADNKTRLSYEMYGLKEVNTMRKDIERGERKQKLDEKLGARV